jgi:hypothetical protein
VGGDGVALLVPGALTVVGHVGAHEGARGEPHAHVLVEAEVDDLLDHPGHVVLALGAVRLEAHVLRTDHRGRRALRAAGALQRSRKEPSSSAAPSPAGREVTGMRFAAPRKFATNVVAGSS